MDPQSVTTIFSTAHLLTLTRAQFSPRLHIIFTLILSYCQHPGPYLQFVIVNFTLH